MDRLKVPVGVLFSSDGPYGAIGTAMRDGALLAIDEVNADVEAGVTFEPVIANPSGRNEAYVTAAQAMMAAGVRHVVGGYTSSSRKELLPVFEKHDGLLWYPSHYEGFETSDHVVYTGAAPNQHVLPLAHFLLAQGQRRGVFLGSNYIWAWENNRILREILGRNGGQVLAERYLAVGETDVGELVELAIRLRPDFIFSTFIGDSFYQFLRGLRARCVELGIDQAVELPVSSCSLAEPELAVIGAEACDGHLTSSVYFASIDTPRNRDWLAAWGARHPGGATASADAEASYNAVHALAVAMREGRSDDPQAVLAVLGSFELDAPQGTIRFDAENRHAHLWPRIGRSRPDASFEVIHAASNMVPPDPYLVWQPLDLVASAKVMS